MAGLGCKTDPHGIGSVRTAMYFPFSASETQVPVWNGPTQRKKPSFLYMRKRLKDSALGDKRHGIKSPLCLLPGCVTSGKGFPSPEPRFPRLSTGLIPPPTSQSEESGVSHGCESALESLKCRIWHLGESNSQDHKAGFH